MKIIFLGAPGAGKGTQADRVSSILGIPTVSTGVIIREAIKNGSELGLKAKKFIDAGELCPDDVVIGIIKARLQESDCTKGFILDGFPRTIAQADALTKSGVKIDKVLSLEVEDEKIVSRLSSRRECSKCGTPYNVISNKPAVEGKCDKCGGDLIQRADDNPETIQNRLNVYHDQTEPIKDYYAKAGLLVTAMGEEELEDTTKNVAEALGL